MHINILFTTNKFSAESDNRGMICFNGCPFLDAKQFHNSDTFSGHCDSGGVPIFL